MKNILQTTSRHTHPGHRRGVVVVLAIVVIMICSGVMAQLARRALLDRRQAEENLLLMQTQELAQAGIRRAKVAVNKAPGWTGETWALAAGQIHQTNEGEVVIKVIDQRVTVVARYPVNHPNPVKITRSTSIAR